MKVVPKLLLVIILKTHSRVDDLHNLDHSPCLFVALFSILDSLQIVHHLLDITAVLRNVKPYSFGIVKQFVSLDIVILHSIQILFVLNTQIYEIIS